MEYKSFLLLLLGQCCGRIIRLLLQLYLVVVACTQVLTTHPLNTNCSLLSSRAPHPWSGRGTYHHVVFIWLPQTGVSTDWRQGEHRVPDHFWCCHTEQSIQFIVAEGHKQILVLNLSVYVETLPSSVFHNMTLYKYISYGYYRSVLSNMC